MGTPVPTPPIEYGDDCASCTPALWPVDGTPKYVYCYFEGLVGCAGFQAPPNGYTFKCEQAAPGTPCRWDHFGSVWNVSFYARELPNDWSRVYLSKAGPQMYFDGKDVSCPENLVVIANDQVDCLGGKAAKDGTCLVSYWDVVDFLVTEFGLTPGRSLFNELFTHPDGDVVIKLCDVLDRINVKFRID